MGVASKLELHTDFKKGSLLNTRSEMSSLLRGGDLPCHYSSSLLCSVLPVSLFIKTYQRLRSEPAGHASHLSTTRNIRKTPTTLGAATVSILLKTPLRDAGCSHCALTFYMRLISSRFPCERLLRLPAPLVIKYRIHRTDFFLFFFVSLSHRASPFRHYSCSLFYGEQTREHRPRVSLPSNSYDSPS